MAYQPNIPTGLVPLNQDFNNLEGNFSSLNSQWLVDHVPLTTEPGPSIGFHTAIHMVPQSPIPTAVAGYGELYVQTLNDGLATGQQLFYQWINNVGPVTINYPLTRNINPSNTSSGYTYLPGGLLFQWGQGSANGSTSFNIAFSSVYAINVTPNGSLNVSPAPAIQSISIGNPGSFVSKNQVNQAYTFYWTAIGT